MEEKDLDFKALGVLAAVVGVTTFGGNWAGEKVVPSRADPFTGSDGERLEEKMREMVTGEISIHEREIRLELQRIENRIERNEVPGLRNRVRNIELYLERGSEGDFRAKDQ